MIPDDIYDENCTRCGHPMELHEEKCNASGCSCRPATDGWTAPPDLDPEVLALCQAMNAWPRIFTTESCCGHGREPFRIWFMPESLDDLPGLLYWFDACHTGEYGWQVRAYTDCSADHVTLVLEGPSGGYDSADRIAKYIQDDLSTKRQSDG